MHKPIACMDLHIHLLGLGDDNIPSTVSRNAINCKGHKTQTINNRMICIQIKTNLCHFLDHCHWLKYHDRKSDHRCYI